MRLSRSVASAIGVAIVAASALAIAAPASAATPGVTYVTAAQVTAAAPGSVGWSQLSGDALASSINGLSGSNYSSVVYGLTTPIATISGNAFSTLGGASLFITPDDAVAHAVILWEDGSGNPQTLLAIDTGSAALASDSALWFSTVFVNGSNVNTLATFDATINGDPAFNGAALLSVGVSFDTTDSVDLQAFTANGAEFRFLPEPVSSAPTTLTQTEYSGSGITITTTGFVPGEELEVYQSFPTATGTDGGNAPAVTADADGAITYTFRPAAGVTPLVGPYNLTFVGAAGAQFFDYSVTLSATLAATGTNSFAPLAAGGVLLLGGAALAILAVNRRRTV